MIGYIVLLLACANLVYSQSPDYVGAYEKFNFSRKYLSSRLGPMPDHPDIHDDQGRRRHSFGILVSVTGAEVKALYDKSNATALEIASKNISYAWSNYNEVSRTAIDYFEYLYSEIKLVTDLIDKCKDVRPKCNDEVNEKTKIGRAYIRPRLVLLSIDEAVTTFKNNIVLIEIIIRRNSVIPYLLNNVNSERYQGFVKQLLKTYTILNGLQ